MKRLERVLAELPARLSELERTIMRQSNTSSAGGGKATKKSEMPLLFDATADATMTAVHAALTRNVQHLCEARGLQPPRLRTSVHMAAWLLAHVESIAQDEAAADMFAGIISISHKLGEAVDNHETRFAGECTAIVSVSTIVTAGEVITLTTPTERTCRAALRSRNGSPRVRCRDCGTVYEASDLMRRILDQNAETLALISFIDAALTDAGYIRKDTARKWLQRDRARKPGEQEFYPWAEDDEGRPMWRMGDFIDKAKRMRERESA